MEKDLVNWRYLSDNERYADLINGFIFHGRQILQADALSDMDAQTGERIGSIPAEKKGKGKKYRDLIRKAAMGINFAVIGMEKQEEVHYLMPLRNMGYDTEEYERQARMIKKKVRKEKGISHAEFLSGFKKDSRLYPCITLVLYFGEEWDGSKDLHGILDFTDIPEELKGLVNNYPIHLLEVRKLENTDVFRTDLKQVFDFIRYSKDKGKLKELVEKDAAYQELDEDAYDMAVAYTHAEELVAAKKFYKKEGKVNMCKALKELIEDGRNKGLERANSLNQMLIRDGRMDDLLKSFHDIGLQKQLLEEYML